LFAVLLTAEIVVALFMVVFSAIDMLRNQRIALIIISGIFGSSLPDIPDVLAKILGLKYVWLTKWMEFNGIFHADSESTVLASFLGQVCIAMAGFIIITILNVRYRLQVSKKEVSK
jgi:hypothetical protein